MLAVVVALLAEADVAAVPAVGQDRPEGVVARADAVGHVVGPVIDPLGVVGPAGVEVVVADAPAVEVQVVDPQRGGVERGAADGLLDLERGAQVGGGGRNSPGRRPRPPGSTAASRAARRSRSTRPSSPRARASPSTRMPACSRPRAGRRSSQTFTFQKHRWCDAERLPRVDDGRGLVALDLAAVPEVAPVPAERRLVAGHEDLVGRLLLAPLGRRRRSSSVAAGDVDPQRVDPVLAPERRRPQALGPGLVRAGEEDALEPDRAGQGRGQAKSTRISGRLIIAWSALADASPAGWSRRRRAQKSN